MKDENAYLKGQFLNIKNEAINEVSMYGIYQVKQDSNLRYHRFTSYDMLIEAGNSVERENYDFIYADSLNEGDNLDIIYERFNFHHPADFKGRSLSISDIIVIKQDGKFKAHYVDEFGFKELPDFFNPKPIIYTKEPIVTIGLTESDYFYQGQQLSLIKANELFEVLDSNKVEERKILDDGYDKTDFQIDYIQDGKPCCYEGRYDIGDGDGTLISHIRARAEHYLSSKGQAVLQRLGAEKAAERTAEYQYLLDNFIPYAILHNELSDLDQHIETQLSELYITEEDGLKRDYYKTVKEYISSCRRNLNTKTAAPLPEFPNPNQTNLSEQERKALNGYKQHIARLPRPMSEQKSAKKSSDMEM